MAFEGPSGAGGSKPNCPRLDRGCFEARVLEERVTLLTGPVRKPIVRRPSGAPKVVADSMRIADVDRLPVVVIAVNEVEGRDRGVLVVVVLIL